MYSSRRVTSFITSVTLRNPSLRSARNKKIESSRWNRRAEEEAVEQEIANTRRAEEATRMLAQEEADREEVRREDRKKNPSKYIPIPNRPPPTLRPEIVALYAQRRIDKGPDSTLLRELVDIANS
ncbi:hypothetical protein M422DRAFT_266051 [Sphaerobolus stellatus SS14]|uniref:Uncharacterized protein n=1 Tax=Sphaerobolus stellatus (strain SS14) TaxID=990650 RepID=A0A0C9TPT5_SPHS4|nr:hypothetical protein M422DRAFT_266051 [Sphaerobolus stellatus SS14]